MKVLQAFLSQIIQLRQHQNKTCVGKNSHGKHRFKDKQKIFMTFFIYSFLRIIFLSLPLSCSSATKLCNFSHIL